MLPARLADVRMVFDAKSPRDAIFDQRFEPRQFMPAGQNEAFSRILIDKALEFSGWDLLDPTQVVFEVHSGAGRAD